MSKNLSLCIAPGAAELRVVFRSIVVWRSVCAVVALLMGVPHAHAQWKFVSSPDMFNSDIGDLSGGADLDIAALYDADYVANLKQASGWVPGGKNSLTVAMARTYNELLSEMYARAGGDPKAFLVAGDLLNGRWPQNGRGLQEMFGGANTADAIHNAADVYYGWYLELLRQNGFDTVLAAIGDHDIGDNSWKVRSNKADQVDTMKRAFGRMMVDPLALPATWNGISSTAPQVSARSEYDEGSYLKQINNVLFVTLDVFRFEDPDVRLHLAHGAVTAEVIGTVGDVNTHLGWLDAALDAAADDPTVDHVIVQGHTPVLSGVRKIRSSGMMMDDRDDSALWRVLQDHSHGRGGKVRMYFGGEVHATTATKDVESDIVQLVHGSPPLGSGTGSYAVFRVDRDVITIEHYEVDLQGDGGRYWQVSEGFKVGTGGMSPGVLTGTLTIDTSGRQTAYKAAGVLSFVRNKGLMLHFGFDDMNGSAFSNTGSLGNVLYQGNVTGTPTAEQGIVGDALGFDGVDDNVRVAGQSPYIEGEQRSITAWVNAEVGARTDFRTIMGMGKDVGAQHRFNLQLEKDTGLLRLNIDNGVSVYADGAPELDDGQWHHVAVILSRPRGNRLGDVVFYIDGVAYDPVSPRGLDTAIFTHGGTGTQVTIGATRQGWGFWWGALDEVALWGRGLAGAEVNAMMNASLWEALRYDTVAMESLFDLHDAAAGTIRIGDRTWGFTPALDDVPGGVFDLCNGQVGVQIDASGSGIMSLLPGDANIDGDVNIDDLAIVLRNWRTASDWERGDFNGDGVTDGRDLSLALCSWGRGRCISAGFAR
ncbi:MAG: hypothetical protein MJE77_46775 [Proteobacteria bacterium]|nr:hypothetical protein [Pseudomonadota bacterium]